MPLAANQLTDGSSGRTPRWKRVLFYLGLVILIVGLNYFAARNDRRQQPQAPAKRSSTIDRKTSNVNNSSRQTATKTDENSVSEKSPTPGNNQSGDENKQLSATKVEPPSRSETLPPMNSGGDLLIRNMRIRNEVGRVIYGGDIDLRPTLDRIERGQRLRFPNDGVVFENRERRLPSRPSGYYHEYVLPTPGDDGPGPQRIVTGREGEVYYTPDHYKSFRRVK